MQTTNNFILRPRFKIKISRNKETILKKFQDSKKTQSDFIISRIDEHVFIKFPKEKQHFWSPQLHLEINNINNSSCVLYGLFGPNPTIWTFFMFLHFIVGLLFFAFGIWTYSNWTLKTSYAFQISFMLIMAIIWIVLYFIGSIGKASSKDEMKDLYDCMEKIIKSVS
ncbi:GTP-binding protein [Mariniflexile litorale]|uniref:GTP-binding protein n=1 Tax=Mariniflexile litorale TaxID=3045158 RepID=A0AAU7EC71_9FLAO|nr:GTP-binding protein [Mariniflexile sp. KMM 9835]MDQ8213404.1 GTP-binding protein [Mariniflexile sp. KMM 9835]